MMRRENYTQIFSASTAGVFAGDPGTFPPQTATVDVTGLQLLNNVVQHNASGVLIASVEPVAKAPDYLVRFNRLQENNGDAPSGNGQGVRFSNAAGSVMSAVLITQNLFNGDETSTSINLNNVDGAAITFNVMNLDNTIGLFFTANVLIRRNTTVGATSSRLGFASGVFMQAATGTTVDANVITGASIDGIQLINNNTLTTVTNNCITDNESAAIGLDGPQNATLVVNGNNVQRNAVGMVIGAETYDPPPNIDSTGNYWGSPSGPDYNGGGPGTGQAILDSDSPDVQSVDFEPFLAAPVRCPLPVMIAKSSPSVNVPPGSPVSFDVTMAVDQSIPTTVRAFSDPLPPLPSGGAWSIASQSAPGFFGLAGVPGSQTLGLSAVLPFAPASGVYSVTVTAPTALDDFGSALANVVSVAMAAGGVAALALGDSATAEASVAVCVRGSSLIRLADGSEARIDGLAGGSGVMGADGAPGVALDVVPCWAGMYGKLFGRCVVIERGALGPDCPHARLAVDAGHPIATPREFAAHGVRALRPARTYLSGAHGISEVTWDAVASLLPGENRRFDIVLPQGSCGAYLANGMVVQSRATRKNPGYCYE